MMKAMHIKGLNCRRIVVLLFVCFSVVTSFPSPASSEEIYTFERMWPTLQQPWYFYGPQGIAVDNNGNVYVTEDNNNSVQKLTSGGQLISKWGSEGAGDGQFQFYHIPQELPLLSGIAVDASSYVYVADNGNHRIQKFTSSGQFVAKWGTEGNADGQFKYPSGICTDGNGNIYVADYGNHRIQKFTSDGQFIAKWGSEGAGAGEFNEPCGICADNNGNIYVADSYNNRIQKFTVDG